jgi:Predicted transcriptional regulators
MDYIILGLNIRNIRKKNHLTQEKLAEKVGISTVFLSQIENANRIPSLETVVNIADSLSVTVDELITNKSSLEQLKIATNINFTSEQLNLLSKAFEKRSQKEIKAILQAFGVLLDINKE